MAEGLAPHRRRVATSAASSSPTATSTTTAAPPALLEQAGRRRSRSTPTPATSTRWRRGTSLSRDEVPALRRVLRRGSACRPRPWPTPGAQVSGRLHAGAAHPPGGAARPRRSRCAMRHVTLEPMHMPGHAPGSSASTTGSTGSSSPTTTCSSTSRRTRSSSSARRGGPWRPLVAYLESRRCGSTPSRWTSSCPATPPPFGGHRRGHRPAARLLREAAGRASATELWNGPRTVLGGDDRALFPRGAGDQRCSSPSPRPSANLEVLEARGEVDAGRRTARLLPLPPARRASAGMLEIWSPPETWISPRHPGGDGDRPRRSTTSSSSPSWPGSCRREQQPLARRLGLAAALVTRLAPPLRHLLAHGAHPPTSSGRRRRRGFSGRDLDPRRAGGHLPSSARPPSRSATSSRRATRARSRARARRPPSAGPSLQIALLDVVFSLDSVITAVGMAQHVEVMVVGHGARGRACMLVFAGPIGRVRRARTPPSRCSRSPSSSSSA